MLTASVTLVHFCSFAGKMTAILNAWNSKFGISYFHKSLTRVMLAYHCIFHSIWIWICTKCLRCKFKVRSPDFWITNHAPTMHFLCIYHSLLHIIQDHMIMKKKKKFQIEITSKVENICVDPNISERRSVQISEQESSPIGVLFIYFGNGLHI